MPFNKARENHDLEPDAAEFAFSRTLQGPTPVLREKAAVNGKQEVNRLDRAKFILESLREPTMKLLQTSVKSPEMVPGMIEGILHEGILKNDPQLGGEPVSEKDIKLTMAMLAEDVRRNAVFRGDETAEQVSGDLIFKLTGVHHNELAELVHGAVMLKGGPEEEIQKTEEAMDKAGL